MTMNSNDVSTRTGDRTNYLQEFKKAQGQPGDAAARLQAEAGLLGKWMNEEPLPFFKQLRHESPVFVTPLIVLVTRYNEVMEVLNANDSFTVDNLTPKLTSDIGDTVLGMNDSPKYDHKKTLLRMAFPRSDVARYRQIVVDEATRMLEGARSGSEFDIVGGYALPLPARAMARYLGVGDLPTEKIVSWMHALFGDIFVNPTNDARLAAAAQTARKEAVPLIDAIIARRKQEIAKAGAPAEPTVLDRYIQMQAIPESFESDEDIRNGIIGLLMGCVDLSAGSITNAIVELMQRPRQLQEAMQAARSDDDTAITGYVLEAMRFRPPTVGVNATCVKDYVIGHGTKHETKIPAGSLVMACSASAMHDGESIEAPDDFRPGRTFSKSYLFWEAGIHTCHGKYVAMTHIVQAVKQLLRAGAPTRVDAFPKGIGYPQPFRARLNPNAGQG